jgi:RNA polymerase sigma-70 factor (sigma-E family)
VDPYSGFEDFVRARTAALSRTAYLLTGDHQLAEDLLQVALTRVASRWAQLRGGAPDAYTRRVMVNELTSWRRRRRYHERPSDRLPQGEPAADPAATTVRRVVVGQALAQLTARQRAILVLRFYEDLSEADTAAALGCSVGAVKSGAHAAMARLRACAPELADLLNESSEVAR